MQIKYYIKLSVFQPNPMIFFLSISFTCLNFYSQSNIFFYGSFDILTLLLFNKIPPYFFSYDLKFRLISFSFRYDFYFGILYYITLWFADSLICCDCFLSFLSIYSSFAAELEETRFILQMVSELKVVFADIIFVFWPIKGGKKLSLIRITFKLVSMKSCLLGFTSKVGINLWLTFKGDSFLSLFLR